TALGVGEARRVYHGVSQGQDVPHRQGQNAGERPAPSPRVDGMNTVTDQDTNKNPEPLPKTLPGVVCAQRVRYGKPGYRSPRGKGHLACFRFWREGGQLRKCYVRRANLAAVRAACEARRRERREHAAAWQHWRQLVAIVREVSK